jgi:hypothetical protein
MNPRAVAALARLEEISAESKRKQVEMEAPGRAIELLFGVTQSQMREAILKARLEGRNATTKLVLPPMRVASTFDDAEAVKLLFGSPPKELKKLGGDGMCMAYRGHQLVVGERLEAV